MTRNTSVVLGDHFTEFVDRQVELGKYGSVSEVIRAALRILEERELQIEALRAAIIEGEMSGPAEPFDVEAFLAAKRAEWSG
jgi:antitoxin ParD1/3/4